MDDAFTYTCKAFELAEGGATVFEVEEYLLLDGFVKLLEGATVGGACFCFVDPGLELGEGDSVEHGPGVADLEDGFYGAVELAPGTVVVVFDVVYDTCLDGVDCRLPPSCKA